MQTNLYVPGIQRRAKCRISNNGRVVTGIVAAWRTSFFPDKGDGIELLGPFSIRCTAVLRSARTQDPGAKSRVFGVVLEEGDQIIAVLFLESSRSRNLAYQVVSSECPRQSRWNRDAGSVLCPSCGAYYVGC
jgi:hypothetical protein